VSSKLGTGSDDRESGTKLLDFYANVSELSEVLIERGYRHVFGGRSRGDQAVHEMDSCFSIAIQSVQVNRHTINFDTRQY
jgi:hypothetical protein